jgi:hypothetical protein
MRPRRLSLATLLIRPLCWPRWLRRVCLLSLPVSVPCWIALLILIPILDGAVQLVRGATRFWNGERRYLYRSDHYGYPSSPLRQERRYAAISDHVPPDPANVSNKQKVTTEEASRR